MSDEWSARLPGVLAADWTSKRQIFGGTKVTRVLCAGLFGFDLEFREREPVGTFECRFVGFFLIVGGLLFAARTV